MAVEKGLSEYWFKIQRSLFPWLEEELGDLTEKEQKLVARHDIACERIFAGQRFVRSRCTLKVSGCVYPLHNRPTHSGVELFFSFPVLFWQLEALSDVLSGSTP